jgi:hypothetical protein
VLTERTHETDVSAAGSAARREAIAMARTLRRDDEGKRVVSPDGSVLGAVATVEDGLVYVAPKPGLMDGWGSWICGPSCDEAFPLDRDVVVDVQDETVVVEPD